MVHNQGVVSCVMMSEGFDRLRLADSYGGVDSGNNPRCKSEVGHTMKIPHLEGWWRERERDRDMLHR